MEPSLKIRTKIIHIVITNACNLTCGGCTQLVGHFPKKKIFHTPVAEIRANIEMAITAAKEDWHQPWFPERSRVFSLYGGEPTVHTDWPEILHMLYTEFPDWPFLIFTNGRTFRDKAPPQSGDPRFAYVNNRVDVHGSDKNIFWRISPKEEDEYFVPALIAPMDVIGDPDPLVYYEMAKKNCRVYEWCETLIYQNKGYFCPNAGAMDLLYHDGANGWDLKPGEAPFKRSNEEIEAQAKLFCHRCYFCIDNNPVIDVIEEIKNVPMQAIHSKTLTSKTNARGMNEAITQVVTFNEEPLPDLKSLEDALENAKHVLAPR